MCLCVYAAFKVGEQIYSFWYQLHTNSSKYKRFSMCHGSTHHEVPYEVLYQFYKGLITRRWWWCVCVWWGGGGGLGYA